MAAPPISHETYQALIQAFRETQTIKGAARLTGISRPTARRAWVEGYPNADPPRPPIRDIIAAEQRATRAAIVDAETAVVREKVDREAARAHEEAEKARKEAIDSRRQEAALVRTERTNVIALVSITGQILRGALKRAGVIEAAVAKGRHPETDKPLTLREEIAMLWQIGRLVKQAAEAAKDVITMERLLLGEPTEIVGTRNLDDVSFDQAVAELRKAAEMAERVEERRRRRESRLRLLQGGAS